MENAFYLMLKALFVLKIFMCLSKLSDHVRKRHNKKAEAVFKIYEVTDCTTNNCNTHITQHLKSKGN